MSQSQNEYSLDRVPPLTEWSYLPKKWIHSQIKHKQFKGIIIPGKNKEIFGFLGMAMRMNEGTLFWFPNVTSEDAVAELIETAERR